MSPLPELPADELSAFLSAIADDPDDSARRLVFADWLDEHSDPRGEFIRLKVAQQALESYSPEWQELRAKTDQLLASFRDAWVGPEFPERIRGWYSINFPGGLPDLSVPGWGLDEAPDYPQDQAIRNCLRQGWVMCVRVREGRFEDVVKVIQERVLDTVSQ